MSSRLFEAAQRAGAEQMSPEEYDAWLEERRKKTDVESSSSQQRQYQGGTFRLGGHGVPSESVQVQANIQRQSSSAASSVSQPVGVQVIMWTDGFSIEDGPLRRFDDPVNRPFLTTLMQG
jgi:UBX domain-containing protein 1